MRFTLLVAIALSAWAAESWAKKPSWPRARAVERVCAPCAIATQDDNPPPVPLTAEEKEERALFDTEVLLAEARQKQILAELKTLDRTKLADDDWAKEWAGSYYDSYLSPRHVSIAPKSGIAYTWYSCLGMHSANHGDVVETFPGGIRVKLAVDHRKACDRYLSSKLYFVRWGDRKYLVPERQIFALASEYNCGGDQREFLPGISRLTQPDKPLRKSLDTPEPPGRPALPAEYAHLIIEKPTRVHVTSVKMTHDEKRGTCRHVEGEVELDAGRAQGLSQWMKLYFDTKISFPSSMIVDLTEVDENTSRGTFGHLCYHGPGPPLKVGMEALLPGAKPDPPAPG